MAVTVAAPTLRARTRTSWGVRQFCVVKVSVVGVTAALAEGLTASATVTLAVGREFSLTVYGSECWPAATVSEDLLGFRPGESASRMTISTYCRFSSTFVARAGLGGVAKVTVSEGEVVAVSRSTFSPSTASSGRRRTTAVALVSPAGMVNAAGSR